MPGPQRRSWAIGLILVTALVLRVWFASHKGLVLDEFHSYFHATRDTMTAFLDGLRQDNHPPLSFLVIGVSRRLFGDSEFALRLPMLLIGVVEIGLVGVLAARFRGARAWVAVAWIACSSLHLDFSTQARMYALHALAVTGVLEAVTAALAAAPGRNSGWARVRLLVWVVVGVHNHYFFFHYLFWGGVVLSAMAIAGVKRTAVMSMSVPLGVAAALSSPWLLWGMGFQWQHGLPPGGKAVGWIQLLESYVHLMFLNVRLGGAARPLFIFAGGLAIVVAGVGALRLFRSADRRGRWEVVLLAMLALGVPALTVATAALFPRSGYTWHYILPSLAPLSLLGSGAVGAGPLLRLRWSAVTLVLGCGAALSLINASSEGTERYPQAVAVLDQRSHPTDAVVSVEWQPRLFPQGQPLDYYRRRQAERTRGLQRLAVDKSGRFVDPETSASLPRIWILSSSLPAGEGVFVQLASTHRREWSQNFGFGVDLILYVRR